MTTSNPNEILLHTRLSSAQIIAVLVPSRSFVVFGSLMFVIWYNLVPVANVASTLLIAAICLALLKLALVSTLLIANPWRVSIDGYRVDFRQGSRIVATCLMTPEETKAIAVVGSQWFPGTLQVARMDGTTLETLYGVCRTDLETVAGRLRLLLALTRHGEQK